MAFVIAHHDDGKEKWQSHEISVINVVKDSNGEIDKYAYDSGLLFSEIYGYGETREEAFDDFKNKFAERFKKLEEFKNNLLDDDICILDTDYERNILNKEEN